MHECFRINISVMDGFQGKLFELLINYFFTCKSRKNVADYQSQILRNEAELKKMKKNKITEHAQFFQNPGWWISAC